MIDVGEDDDSNYVQLRVTNGDAHGLYIALSHRWQNDTPITTTANLNERRNGITLDCLPKAYQDTMHITRKLGIRFLWIDSLCIVQQDRTDWESEATRMGEVFAFAYCTIAIYPPKEASGSFEEGIEGGELSRRGWISQERGLSRRTIHFVGEQMYWECGSVVWDKTSDKGSRCVSLAYAIFGREIDSFGC
ncbi:hypothetical protein sscle_01g004670 [Sclerotinia sclerotiorum 1980 UF-70]|uniref:Heterokaryon incompatibility domain-containing protein n=1 Tax=Sclerotinia sclerotiorum (strain ATCC 18683 / 1980 / Ss-1) TaxID=665079 RepID=A0A1D9PSM9_SCLS1|nr:hypothetical protein sscle_01g004670 [Sclerotinia sclerotiorum 1980 UF-70]